MDTNPPGWSAGHCTQRHDTRPQAGDAGQNVGTGSRFRPVRVAQPGEARAGRRLKMAPLTI